MTHNKDRGTSVGFSNDKNLGDLWEHNKAMNTVCKEHEWHLIAFRPTSNSDFIHESRCKNCGILKPPTDFHIKENLKVISDNEWEDIWLEYEKSDDLCYTNTQIFFQWLKENYNPPTKK